jgi:hypothetical protein
MGLIPDFIVLLESKFGFIYGINLFKGPKAKIPDGNGPYISLIRTGGLDPEETHNSPDVPAYEKPGVQVLIRATDYDVAENLALALWAFFYPLRDQFINGTWYREVNIHGSEPFDLPPDEKGRPRLAFNLDCVKRTSPATS